MKPRPEWTTLVLALLVACPGASAALESPGPARIEAPTANPQFLPYVVYPLARGANALAIGDVTGDGLQDVVAVNAFADSVYVFRQNPSGMLDPPVRYSAPITYFDYLDGSVDIADMNHDGRLDVVTALDNAVGVMLQTPGGLLSGPVSYPTVHSSFSNVLRLRAGDFNHDGLADVVSIDWGTQSYDVDVFRQTSAGTLGPSTVYSVVHGGYDDLVVGDVNGDGLPDVVVMSGQSFVPNFGVLIQNSGGTFDPPVYYSLSGNVLTHGVAIGDVNHDGRNDVVVSWGGNKPSSFVSTFLQDGAGHLVFGANLPSYDIPSAVRIGDINGDGRNDIVVLHDGWLALGLYLQNADGTFQPEQLYPIPYASSYNPHGLAIGDLNNDGLPDVAIADYNSGVVVLYNAGIPTPVLISPVDARSFVDRIELVWSIQADPGAVATIERSEGAGTWRVVGTGSIGGNQQVTFTDRNVEPGRRYGYRVSIRGVVGGEVWVEATGPLSLALYGPRPNPCDGHMNVSFALPSSAPATLELLDLTGRQISMRDAGALGVGTHSMELAHGAPVAPGVYWLRLTQGANVRTSKATVMR